MPTKKIEKFVPTESTAERVARLEAEADAARAEARELQAAEDERRAAETARRAAGSARFADARWSVFGNDYRGTDTAALAAFKCAVVEGSGDLFALYADYRRAYIRRATELLMIRRAQVKAHNDKVGPLRAKLKDCNEWAWLAENGGAPSMGELGTVNPARIRAEATKKWRAEHCDLGLIEVNDDTKPHHVPTPPAWEERTVMSTVDVPSDPAPFDRLYASALSEADAAWRDDQSGAYRAALDEYLDSDEAEGADASEAVAS